MAEIALCSRLNQEEVSLPVVRTHNSIQSLRESKCSVGRVNVMNMPRAMLQLNHRNGNGMKETLNIRKELSLKLGLEIKVLLPYDTASRYRFSPTSHWNLI